MRPALPRILQRSGSSADGIAVALSIGSSPPAHPAETAQAIEGAMLRKVKEHQELQGEATVGLIEAASPSRPPDGTGSLVNDVA